MKLNDLLVKYLRSNYFLGEFLGLHIYFGDCSQTTDSGQFHEASESSISRILVPIRSAFSRAI